MDSLVENALKEFLTKRRNTEKATLCDRETEKNGYFDAQDFSGGNFDDCFSLGMEVGEAQLIEEILQFFEDENSN